MRCNSEQIDSRIFLRKNCAKTAGNVANFESRNEWRNHCAIPGTDDPDYVFAETIETADNTRDELITFLCSAIGRGRAVERENAIYPVAHHLGFRRVSNTVTDETKSAINGAIRRGILGYEGTLVWRND